MMDNKNNMKNEIPPNDGFAWGLHLIRSSGVFLVPRLDANFKNKLLIKKENRIDVIKNDPYTISK